MTGPRLAACLALAAAVACGSWPQAARDCDASYPGPCIWPAPPDLDCDDIVHRGFTVLPPDPHGFDLDGDGVGCLSPRERARQERAPQEQAGQQRRDEDHRSASSS